MGNKTNTLVVSYDVERDGEENESYFKHTLHVISSAKKDVHSIKLLLTP